MSPRTLPSCMSNANLRPFAKNACSSRRSAQAPLSRLRRRLPKLAGSRSSPLADRELLHPEVADFADVERVLAAAIDRVDGAELFQQFACFAKLSNDGSVETHLVDFAGRVEVVRRIGIRDVHDRVRGRRDADGLGVADVLDFALEGAVVVEHLDAHVPAVGGVHVALRVDGDTVDAGELAGRGTLLPP